MTSIVISAPTGDGSRARVKAYSSFEPYELEEYLRQLAVHLPDVAIEIERMSTAALRNRLEAEKDNPQVDMILGWADTAAKTVALSDKLFSPQGDADGYLRITGFSTAIVVDPDLLKQLNVNIETWRDLAHPALRGRIAFPNPAQSGAGFLALTTLLQAYGESDGWPLLSDIYRNVQVRPDSAWEPARLTGEGEIAAGVTVKIAAFNRKRELPRLKIIEPPRATGTESEVYAGFITSAHREAVSEILEWLQTEAANRIYTSFNKLILTKNDDSYLTIDAGQAVLHRTRWLTQLESLTNGMSL
ncbi:extracellular solute-binding protein [Dickeya poaceiphila]|uniref:Extracellular solute-binding protein n=1 Tax=Dickeya poaceiphila TaxID=568768 RepID=A0A5B8IBP9_9GAMM|nr:extracellular solute-binding protein [Dickeya poaceiphila]QDX31018.1 extracellular solute-binding protein [Dickeya poaceiphila]